MRVEYGPYARATLERLGKAVGAILDQELKILHARSWDEFERLGTQAEPPWWRVNLNEQQAAIFRSNGRAGSSKGILVCDIVSARDRNDELERSIGKREDVEHVGRDDQEEE